MLRITSKKDGFRRCGVAHSKQPVEYADDRFSEKELGILQAESMLIVEVIADEGSLSFILEEKKTEGQKAKGKPGEVAAEKATPDILPRDK